MTDDDLERRLQAWYQAEIGKREAATLAGVRTMTP